MYNTNTWVSISLALILTSPIQSFASEVTDIADAVDTIRIGDHSKQDLFDAYLSTSFELRYESGIIAREGVSDGCSQNTPSGCEPVEELAWNKSTSTLNIDAEIGLFRDLSFTLRLPIIIGQSLSFKYADGITAAQSSIDPVTGNANDTLFSVADAKYEHSGVGNLELGLRYGPLNDARDHTKPNWIMFFKWAMPWTTEIHRPGQDTAATQRPVGTGVHYITFGTALSKRVANLGLIGIDPKLYRRGYLDPYFSIAYVLPVPDRNLAEEPLLVKAGTKFGMKPSHQAKLTAGLEIVPYEELKEGQRFAIDIGMRANFHSEGRNYSLLTDPLEELTYTDQFLEIGGRISFIGQPMENIKLLGSFEMGSRSKHFLTNENIGKDANGDNQVNEDDGEDNLNPYWCGNTPGDKCSTPGQQSYDQIGYRFRDQGHTYWALNFKLQFLL
jgi:hypothetical protein